MKKIFCLTCIILVLIGNAISQTRKQRIETARTTINALLQTYKDGTFHVGGGIVDVDSSIGHNDIADGHIQDPYGTLRHAFLFIAQSKVNDTRYKYITGIFRDNQILWTSEPVIDEKYSSTFFNGSFDLNKDGKVDIITVFNYGPRSEYEIWWIYSWDDITGSCISAVTPEGYPVIQMMVQSYWFIDIDGDGILEITGDIGYMAGSIFNKEREAVFSWNGSLYGEWPNGPTLAGRKFTVANKLEVDVKCEVNKNNDSLTYRYTVHNSNTSKQALADFYVDNEIKNSIYSAPAPWEGGRLKLLNLSEFSVYEFKTQVIPGESILFSIRNDGLPKISTFYAQGPYQEINLDIHRTEQQWIDDTKENLETNSFRGTTIGPSIPPNPFVPLNFLDTLRSYIRQSHTLGWINNTRDDDSENDENAEDGIVKNLDKRLEKVRDFIVKKKYDKAGQQLEKFLNKVEKLWNRQQKEEAKNKTNPKIIFTSEAYALMKYNAEYLRQQLPAKK